MRAGLRARARDLMWRRVASLQSAIRPFPALGSRFESCVACRSTMQALGVQFREPQSRDIDVNVNNVDIWDSCLLGFRAGATGSWYIVS